MRHYDFILSLFAGLLMLAQTGSAQTAGTQKWVFTTGSDVRSSPAIGLDGTIYIGSYDDKLYALNPNGSQKWAFSTGNNIFSSPAIGVDGTIYMASWDDKLYAIKPDGVQKWVFTAAGDVSSSPAIAVDGTVYVGSKDNKLYAIDPDGTQKWAFLADADVDFSPVIGGDGTVYFGSGSKFYALNPDGTLKWTFTLGGSVGLTSSAIGADGTIYVGSYDNKLYALSPDGTVKWTFTTGDAVQSPAIGTDGTIYVGSRDDRLYAINSDGTQKWAFATGSNVTGSPAVGADGTIYVGSWDNKLYAINPDGTQKWAFTTQGDIVSHPALDQNGTIYIGSVDGKLYAVYSNSAGLAPSLWPKFHQNNQNTGSLQIPSIADQLQFSFFNTGGNVQKTFAISNPTLQAITLSSAVFDDADFSLVTSLPMTIPAGTSAALTATIRPDTTRLYQSTCQLTYTAEDQSKTASGKISAGLFLEDGSERTYAAHRALNAYNACKANDASSVATRNNLGVLYRLLREPVIAEQTLLNALSAGLNAKYGYSGIKMNMGVVKSDQKKSVEADTFYVIALRDVSSTESASALAPQLYYNKAWEAYTTNNLSEALTEVNKTIVHNMANACLKAKAYVLRGATQYRQGNVDGAQSDFRQAISLNPDCSPIVQLAQENLQAITSVDDGGENMARVFVLLPNYPNPFNPETTISLGLPRDAEVELVIYNVLGQLICTLHKGRWLAGWHNVTWYGMDDNGKQVGSGVYVLQLKADGFEFNRKMTLLR